MWQPFAAGAAWAVAFLRGSASPLECHCTCRCELAETGVAWGWEIIKAILWLLLGVGIQALKVIPALIRQARQVVCSDQRSSDAGGPTTTGLSPTLEAEQVLEVEQRAKEQIQALRSRK